MCTAADTVGTCGSALVLCEDGVPLSAALPNLRYAVPKPYPAGRRLITTQTESGGFTSRYEPARPMPQADGWFETVWEAYRRRMQRITE